MLDYGKLREVVDNIKDKKDNWRINFATKYPVAWIYRKIDQIEYQLVVNTGAEISVYTKSIVDLLKLKPKLNKTMTVVAIDRVKQKSLGNTGIVIVKVIDQST